MSSVLITVQLAADSCIFLYIIVYCVSVVSESAVSTGRNGVDLSPCGLLLILVYSCIFLYILVYYVSGQSVSSMHGMEWNGTVFLSLCGLLLIFHIYASPVVMAYHQHHVYVKDISLLSVNKH